MKLKAGIIGLGKIASLYEEDARAKKYYPYLTHAGSYFKHPSIELICGADIDKRKLKEFNLRWGVKRLYTDYNRMLEENDLDILSICVHPAQHLNIIESVLKFVKVIFCEKPFANNSEEIRRIIAIKNKSEAKIAINLYREYDRSHNRIRELLRDEKYGKIQRVNCYYGKGLRNMGTHLIGYLIGTLGHPQRIEVLGKKKYRGVPEFSYDMYMQFSKGIPALIQSCDFNKYRLFEIDFICEKGRVQILDEGLSIKTFKVKENKAESGAHELFECEKSIRSTVGYALYYAVEHLIDLNRKKKLEPIVSPERYLDLQLIIEEIEKQGADIKCLQN